jgi:hypothetical protein
MQLPTSTALLLAAALGSGARASAGPDLGVGEMLTGGSVLFPRQAATGQNLQAFTGALGGIKADAVTNSGNSERPFEVDGDTFTDFNSAAQRSCDNQKNKCAQTANSGDNKAGFEVSDCDQQNSEFFFFPCDGDGCYGMRQARLESIIRMLTGFMRADQCKDAIKSATQTAFLTLASSNAEFDFFCES